MSESKIIVRVDGGICSQIAFVSLGMWLEKEYNVSVKYDLSWFDTWGKDMNGTFERNWDMIRAFPKLSLDVASTEEVDGAMKSGVVCETLDGIIDFCINRRGDIAYLCGYPNRDDATIHMSRFLKDGFQPQLDEGLVRYRDQLINSESCAVHIRRGDLAVPNPYYGNPTSLQYFKDAIGTVKGLYPDTKFYFFSDEPEWCERNLFSVIGGGDMSLNGSDKGYIDLYLMAKCKRIISSHGSLGVYAALLGDCDLLVMSNKRDWITQCLDRVIYFNDDRLLCAKAWEPPKTQNSKMCHLRKDGWRKPFYKIHKHLTKVLSVR